MLCYFLKTVIAFLMWGKGKCAVFTLRLSSEAKENKSQDLRHGCQREVRGSDLGWTSVCHEVCVQQTRSSHSLSMFRVHPETGAQVCRECWLESTGGQKLLTVAPLPKPAYLGTEKHLLKLLICFNKYTCVDFTFISPLVFHLGKNTIFIFQKLISFW